ncbi:cyclic nucleotide-binding domain-containing protein [Thermodesulfobacteriota bacterium]
MISLDFLEKVEVFKGLDDDRLSAVLDCCQESEYHRGEKLFGVKEKPLYLWAVIEGEIELRQERPESTQLKEICIASLTETMTFGWSSLVPPFKYSLSAYCASRSCRVLTVEAKCLTRLFQEDSKLGYMLMSKIVSVVGTRFYQLREEIIKGIGQDIINHW